MLKASRKVLYCHKRSPAYFENSQNLYMYIQKFKKFFRNATDLDTFSLHYLFPSEQL